jgi:hypothetical protein
MTQERIEFRLDLETSGSQPFRRNPSLLRCNDGIILTMHQQYLGEVFSFRLGRGREPARSGYIGADRPTPGRDSVERHDRALRKAEEREATTVYRLGQELDALGPLAGAAKQALASYTQNVAQDEWPRLAKLPASLSPLAQKNLDDLWVAIRSTQKNLAETAPSRSDYRADLSKYASQIETSRSGRLSAATLNIPDDFWIILLLFVVAASFFSGRETAKRFGVQINMMHMSAIGLAVGLVIVLDNPFRGETRIGPEIIQYALTH